MAEPAVSLDHVSKKFRISNLRRTSFKERVVKGKSQDHEVFWALRDATFDIPRGTTFALVGPNGSGKSTTLKVIAGIYRPTSGSVSVNGRLSALLELGAGFHPELTGRENITLNASILGMSPAEIEAATGEIVEFADLGDHIDAPVKVYSSGMYVRLGFAIAVAVRPEILVIDEVIAVGDEQFQRKCFDHLHSLKRSGATIVLVSHSLGVIESMCDEAVWIDQGEIQLIGSGRSVARKYLESVNEEKVHVDPATGLRHLGSGEARIKSLAYGGEEGQTIVSGGPFEVRITYESSSDVEDVIVGLAFISETGVRVAGPTSHDSGLLTLSKGTGEVRFSCDDLVLMPGRYVVSVAFVSNGHYIDNVPDQFTLVVNSSGGVASGVARMPGDWHVFATASVQSQDSVMEQTTSNAS